MRPSPIATPAPMPMEPKDVPLPAHLDTGSPEIAHLDLAPVDTVADAGRARSRNRRVALTGLTSTAAQMGISLVTVPLTLKYLGAERFGLWMTMLELAPWVLRWWVGPTIRASFAMVLGLAVWACFGAVGYAVETF